MTKNALEEIEKGKIKMRPRWHFVLRGAALAFALILAIALAAYLISFIFFIADRDGLLLLPRFGWHGTLEFFISLPWLIIIGVVLLVLIIEGLSLRFGRLYLKPLAYSILGLILLLSLMTFLINRGNLHERLEERLPFFKNYYSGFDVELPPDVYTVTVDNQISGNTLPARDRNGQSVIVQFNQNTVFISGQDIDPGDILIILGSNNANTISASKIQKIEGNDSLPSHLESELKERDWMK